jgi:hypothetical protein
MNSISSSAWEKFSKDFMQRAFTSPMFSTALNFFYACFKNVFCITKKFQQNLCMNSADIWNQGKRDLIEQVVGHLEFIVCGL